MHSWIWHAYKLAFLWFLPMTPPHWYFFYLYPKTVESYLQIKHKLNINTNTHPLQRSVFIWRKLCRTHDIFLLHTTYYNKTTLKTATNTLLTTCEKNPKWLCHTLRKHYLEGKFSQTSWGKLLGSSLNKRLAIWHIFLWL